MGPKPRIWVQVWCDFSHLEWEDQAMRKSRFSDQQIALALQQVEHGASVAEVCRKLGIAEQTYYRWRIEYGGMRVEQARKLKSLEKENAQLKKLVADLSLDNTILKEVAEGNY